MRLKTEPIPNLEDSSALANDRAVPLVYISVLNWNGAQNTIRCLESVARLDYPNYHVLVVDNASLDDSVDRIRAAFPDIDVIQSRSNIGYAGGHSLAVACALGQEAELIWLLNPDVTFDPDALSSLVDAYRQYGAGIYGSLVFRSDDPDHIGMTSYAIDASGKPALSQLAMKMGDLTSELFPDHRPKRVANVSGCSILIPASIIQQFGFMDTSLFLYAEERDYCLRLSRAGVSVYVVPDSKILHENQASTKNNPALRAVARYYLRRNGLIMLRRHYGWRRYLSEVFAKHNVKFMLKIWASTLIGRKCVEPEQWFGYLALIDAVLNRRGKTISPEDYLKEKDA